MAVPFGSIGNTSVGNDYFSRALPRFELDDDKFGRLEAILDLPSVNKSMRRLDNLELPDDPDDAPVRKLVADAIAASYTQINLRGYTSDAVGAPPLLELARLRQASNRRSGVARMVLRTTSVMRSVGRSPSNL